MNLILKKNLEIIFEMSNFVSEFFLDPISGICDYLEVWVIRINIFTLMQNDNDHSE